MGDLFLHCLLSQELTKLRIIDIQGVDKPEDIGNPSTVASKKQEQVAVAA